MACTPTFSRHIGRLTVLHILAEVGVGLDRREQSLRDRHLLAYGTSEQRSFVVVDLLMNYPLRTDLTNLALVLGASYGVADARSVVQRLGRAMRRESAGAIADVGALKQLDAALKHAVFGLSAVALATGPLADRITFVETALGHANPAAAQRQVRSAAGSGGSASGVAPGGVGRSLLRPCGTTRD